MMQLLPSNDIANTTSITIGGKKYDIETSKIPYLSLFVDFQAKSQPAGSDLVHGSIPLFAEALRGIQSGYRQCFRAVPPDLAQYHVLCETYEFLGIDVLGGQDINSIFADLKSCKTDWELEYKYYRAVKGNKSKARDAAFKLVYLMLLGEFADENKDCAKAFNAVLFVVSHSATFKKRARTVTRAAYEERFVVSAKQISKLDEWAKKGSANQEDTDEDVTTEEESSDSYNSDAWD
jgi:hypothetical protein